MLTVPDFPLSCRRQAWCLSTCSWNDTRRRSCTGLIQITTGRVSVTALITRLSSFTRTPGREDAVPQTSPAKPRSRWAPITPLCSSVLSIFPLPPAEKALSHTHTHTCTYRKVWLNTASKDHFISIFFWEGVLSISFQCASCFNPTVQPLVMLAHSKYVNRTFWEPPSMFQNSFFSIDIKLLSVLSVLHYFNYEKVKNVASVIIFQMVRHAQIYLL